jgi:hypothetical protein
MSRTVQVVTSALNEEKCLPEFYERITEIFERNPKWSHHE